MKTISKLDNWWKRLRKEEKYGYIALAIFLVALFCYTLFVAALKGDYREGCVEECKKRLDGNVVDCYFEDHGFFATHVPENYTMLSCQYVFNESLRERNFYLVKEWSRAKTVY
jgi:hypothetical protein